METLLDTMEDDMHEITVVVRGSVNEVRDFINAVDNFSKNYAGLELTDLEYIFTVETGKM